MFCVVVLVCHEVPAAEVEPFERRKPTAELVLDLQQGTFECMRIILAMAVAMESFHAVWESFRHFFCGNAEARARCAWVVYFGCYLGAFGVYAKSYGDFMICT